MVAHQQKKVDDEALRVFRDRFNIPITDEEIARLPFCNAGGGERGAEVPARAARELRRLFAEPAAQRRHC